MEQTYEGIAPKHCVWGALPTKDGVDGRVKVHIISIDEKEARVRVPDSQILTVSANKVQEI